MSKRPLVVRALAMLALSPALVAACERPPNARAPDARADAGAVIAVSAQAASDAGVASGASSAFDTPAADAASDAPLATGAATGAATTAGAATGAATAAGDDATFCLAHTPVGYPPHKEQCHWRTFMRAYCGGAQPRPDQLRPQRACICDRCAKDGDCADGRAGRCVVLPSTSFCGSATRVCVYAGDACYPPTTRCAAGQACAQDEGRASCVAPPRPPP